MSNPSNTSSSLRPVKKNGYSRSIINARRNQRRKDANERQARYDVLTIDEKLKTLIPGGSTRQRARLEKLKAGTVTTPTPVPKAVKPVKAKVKK